MSVAHGSLHNVFHDDYANEMIQRRLSHLKHSSPSQQLFSVCDQFRLIDAGLAISGVRTALSSFCRKCLKMPAPNARLSFSKVSIFL